MAYPRMFRVKQKFEDTFVEDIPGTVRQEMKKLNLSAKVKPGQTVAITAGSRGVINIDTVIGTMASELKAMGAKPFIFPAMGSHAGATAEGQREILAHYGITEKTMGCPVRATMDTVQISTSPDGIPVYLDKYASEADHVIVVNRIKPHTDLKGPIESGLMKMMLIGMGKYQGAIIYHKAFVTIGFQRIIDGVAREVIKKAGILFGMALVENAYDQTAIIKAIRPEELIEEEEKLQARSKELMASLPFDDVDILIVDEMGKNISGTGMDTNILGRFYSILAHETAKPKIKRVFVRDLTEETMGNAIGIGLADVTVNRLVKKIDWEYTYINGITGTSPEKVRLPMHYETDKEALQACFDTIGLVEPEDARVIRIKNTLLLREVEVSDAYLKELKKRDDLEIVKEAREMEFDSGGNLLPLQ